MWHVWISSLGVTAAIILAGGYVALQILRERHQFQLMRAALDQGITDFTANAVPSWFVSMRQAVVVFVLGIGLMAVGGATWGLAGNVAPPTAAEIATPSIMTPPSAKGPADLAKTKRAIQNWFHPPKPPPPNPALERWHQAQQEETIGMVVTGCGVLITLLGAVRIVFAVAERKQFAARTTAPAESS